MMSNKYVKTGLIITILIIIYIIAGPETMSAGAVLGVLGSNVSKRRKHQKERELINKEREIRESKNRETQRDQARLIAEKEAQTWLDSDF